MHYCFFRHKLEHSHLFQHVWKCTLHFPLHSSPTIYKMVWHPEQNKNFLTEVLFWQKFRRYSRGKSIPLVSIMTSNDWSGTSYLPITVLTMQGIWAEKQNIPWSQIYSKTHIFWVLGVTTGWQLLNVSGNSSFQLPKHTWLLRFWIDVI